MNSTSSEVASASSIATTKKIIKYVQAEHVHRQLLYDLMSSIYEYIVILTTQVNTNDDTVARTAKLGHQTSEANIDYRLTPNVESLLLHIHSCLEQIFLNGLRIFKPDKSPDLWRFFEALNWINPHLTVSIGSQTLNSTNSVKRVQAPKSSRIRNDKALMWLYENLLAQQLITKLQCLLSDTEHLTNCYEVTLAFLGSSKFVGALFICLNAFNEKQNDILLQIDQNLYVSVINESLKSSAATTTTKMNVKSVNEDSRHDICDTKLSKSSLKNGYESFNPKCRNSRSRCRIRHSIGLQMRKFVSLPDLRHYLKSDVKNMARPRSQSVCLKSRRLKLTAANLALNNRQNMPCAQNNQQNTAYAESNRSVNYLQPINLVKCDDIKIHTDRRTEELLKPVYDVPSRPVGLIRNSHILPYLNTSHASSTESSSSGKKLTYNSMPRDFVSFFAANGAKIENRYQSSAILDSIESSSSPLCNHDECALIPNRGQSITSYLQEAQRIRRNITDLERENAHFGISDAIMSAIEEIKCSQMERKLKKQVKATSQLKRRKSHQRPLRKWILRDDPTCDKSMTNLTDDETSSISSESITTLSQASSNESDLSHISSSSDSSTPSNAGDLKRLKIFSVSSYSINELSAFAEWAENSSETLSAEGIALSLISKFKDYQLPRAADLLFSNSKNAMDSMLDESQGKVPYTRGTPEWAPPRAQIIFTRHPILDRRALLEQQKFRCSGCGMHIDAAYINSLRYCEYSGKYHCTGCHRNQISAIPARVLDRWDFSYHPVSVFSYRLLDQIWKVPLFRVPDLNKELYSRVRSLRYCHFRRLQLKYVHDFIQLCRFADDDKVNTEFENIPSYVYDDVDKWSMFDFVNVRNGTFLVTINTAIQKGEEHVLNCELCTAHGFICEHCSNKQVIFPWQPKVTRCEKCGTCAHTKCSKNPCLKCQRLEKRIK